MFSGDPNRTDEERRLKGLLLRFWAPVIVFVSVWVFCIAFFDFLRWLKS